MKHTPGEWVANGNYITLQKLQHDLIAKTLTYDFPQEEAVANAQLIALAPTAPHECDDPNCPGNINRLRLEAFDDLLEACQKLLYYALEYLRDINVSLGKTPDDTHKLAMFAVCKGDIGLIKAAITKATGGE